MTTATLSPGQDFDWLLETLGIDGPLPRLTPGTFWAPLLGVRTKTLQSWSECQPALFPRPVFKSKRKCLYSSREVLQHLAAQRKGLDVA